MNGASARMRGSVTWDVLGGLISETLGVMHERQAIKACKTIQKHSSMPNALHDGRFNLHWKLSLSAGEAPRRAFPCQGFGGHV